MIRYTRNKISHLLDTVNSNSLSNVNTMNCRGEGGGERKNPHPHTTEGGQTQREDPGSNDEPGAPKETRNEKAESTPAPFDETNAKECGTRGEEGVEKRGKAKLETRKQKLEMGEKKKQIPPPRRFGMTSVG